jgi:hypothetical protein
LIKGIELGVVEPGGCVVKRVWLVCTGVKGERVVDVEVLTRVVEGEGGGLCYASFISHFFGVEYLS